MVKTRTSEGTIRLGIEPELFAHPGDHVAYLWENDAEFERGVRFLGVGLEEGDACVVFGHEEANEKVLAILRKEAIDVDSALGHGRLVVIGGESTGEATLDNIGRQFKSLRDGGARTIRLLGNIGWGRSGWPTDTDILAFESKVTGAIRDLPCVVVCMYDVRSLSGQIVVHGAFETHPLTFCRNVLRENPHHVPIEEFLASLKP
ncbi:MAG: MEDS domain-containing protein [Acidobacteria bacterium]|nr:MEDS domain-containing protein [Acidobacteriota bacterium]